MTFTQLKIHTAAFQTVHSIIILGILLVCSLACLAVIVERWLYFRRIKTDPEKTLLKIRRSLIAGKIDETLGLLDDVEGNPVLTVIQTGVQNSQMPKEQVGEMMRACQMKQKGHLERNLAVLGTLGNVAPFIGLLGTVLGIIQAFQDLAGPQSAAGASVVAVGIAEALVATAAGLAVAIPAVVFYNIFLKKVKHIIIVMEVAAIELLVLLSLKTPDVRQGEVHAG